MTPSQYASMLEYAEAGFPGLDADLGEGSTDKLRAIIRILSENPGSVAHTNLQNMFRNTNTPRERRKEPMDQATALNGKPVNAACIKPVIEVQAVRGKGTNADPCRVILQYWSLDGELLAENDALMVDADPETPHLPQ